MIHSVSCSAFDTFCSKSSKAVCRCACNQILNVLNALLSHAVDGGASEGKTGDFRLGHQRQKAGPGGEGQGGWGSNGVDWWQSCWPTISRQNGSPQCSIRYSPISEIGLGFYTVFWLVQVEATSHGCNQPSLWSAHQEWFIQIHFIVWSVTSCCVLLFGWLNAVKRWFCLFWESTCIWKETVSSSRPNPISLNTSAFLR